MRYLFFLGLLVCGCGSAKKYESHLRTMIGHDSDELILKMGVPSSEYKLNNGKKVLHYDRHLGTSGYADSSGFFVSRSNDCTTDFFVGPTNIIEAYRFEGHCKSK
jgi:hypothetical protein